MRLNIVSYDGQSINDGVNYRAWFPAGSVMLQADGKPQFVKRPFNQPILAYKDQQPATLPLVIQMLGAVATQIDTLKKWLSTFDQTERVLLVEDTANSNKQWYIYATPVSMSSIDGPVVTFTLAVKDPVWLSNTQTTDTWNVTATGQQRTITPGGNQKSYPIYRIKPTSAKAGGFLYGRFLPIYNQTARTFTDYPFDLGSDAFDTAALVTAGKMQADGDDLRVYIDGAEVDRWLDGINTTTTKIWVNVNLSPKAEATLATAIASSGAVTSVVCSTDITGFPASGLVLIDSEVFTYTGKNNSTKTFTGTTRAAKGTAMAAHSSGATVRWLEREVWIFYGNSSLTAPTTDDNYKPIFNLATSTNTSWDYDDFWTQTHTRVKEWEPLAVLYTIGGSWVADPPQIGYSADGCYSDNHGASATPGPEIGFRLSYQAGFFYAVEAQWRLYNPAGITNWNFANGEKAATVNLTWFDQVSLQRSTDGISWTTEYDVTAPTAVSTWESWSDSRALGATAYYVRLYGKYPGGNGSKFAEAADVTLTISSAGIPAVSIGGEQNIYQLQATLTNTATSEAITLTYQMSLNQTLEVDTTLKTVTYLADNSSAIFALSWSAVRYEWLPLLGGQGNVLQYDETGAAGVEVKTLYRDRNN